MVLLVVAALAHGGGDREPADAGRPTPSTTPPPARASPHPTASTPSRQAGPPYRPGPPILPPVGSRPSASHIFADGRFLVAYYGTAGTGALGVLGETSPEQMQARLAHAARAFIRPKQPVQLVYELIVTIADRTPGPDHSYSHDIAAADVRRYLAAAHRHHAMLLLDLQPGRSSFLQVAKRWAWALRDPSVGLALDPEWRMQRGEVPGHTVGSVGAAEVNATSRWLTGLQRRYRLPEKLFVIHQFRTDMIEHADRIRARRGLAEVQHVDGFGTPGQKLATYHAVARPRKFFMGFKLFYDEDVHRLGSDQVHSLRPTVRFVSFQ